MSSIEALKEQARRHEQKEEWIKALEQYQKAIDKLDEEEQPDIGLYNRVGDLHTRVGNSDAAVRSYESAVDLYLEADLPNNAIAVCKKILRNLPDRHQAFLRMGQIRASQGFLVDARQNFLTYAERVQAAGETDEALRALAEFADLAPDDTDIRMMLASQFESHDRSDEAIEQLVAGHAILTAKGDREGADAFEAKLRELDPEGADARLTPGAGPSSAPSEDDHAFAAFGEVAIESDAGDPSPSADADEVGIEVGGDFAEIDFGGDEDPAADDAADPAVEAPEPVAASDSDEGAEGIEVGDFEIALGGEDPAASAADDPASDDAADDDAFELPTFGTDAEDDAAAPEASADPEKDEAAAELEAMAASLGSFGGSVDAGSDGDDDEAPEGGDLPLMAFDDGDSGDDVPEGGDLPMMTFDDEEAGAAEPSDDDALEPVAADFSLEGLDGEEADDVPEGGDLPMMSFDDDEPAAESATDAADDADDDAARDFADAPSPMAEAVEAAMEDTTFDAAADEREAEVAPDAEASAAEPSAAEPPTVEASAPDAEPAAPADPRARYEALEAEAAERPADVELRQRMLEVAYQVGDDAVQVRAYLGLAQALTAAGNAAKAQAMYQQVLSLDPGNAEARAALDQAGPETQQVTEVAASEDYVDLGSLILGDEEEKTTRFVVAYEEPSGDEDADFAKMLSQFKAKVAENFDASDVKAHHDLGTAYKEMGLLDEAIEEFQQALRASANHLPTYELLGQAFMEKGQYDAAARVLNRALQADWEIEDELLGIYYYLGRANEALGRNEEAAGFYDQVFSLDINFADVTERLRNLR